MPSLQKAGGLRFNGTNDYVQVPSGLTNSLTAITLEGWLNWRGGNSFQRLFDFASGSNIPSSSGSYFYITLHDGLSYRFSIANLGTGSEVYVRSASPFPTNIPTHLVVTLANGVATLYLNGVKTASGTISLTPNQVNAVNAYIGKSAFLSDPNFNGTIYATRIYNRVLSPSEVQMNYQGQVVRDASLVGEWLLNATSGTVATDTSGNANHGTLNGGTWGNKAVKQKPKKNMFNKLGLLNQAPPSTPIQPTTYDATNDLIVTTGVNGVAYGGGQAIQVIPNTNYVISFTVVGKSHRIALLNDAGVVVGDTNVSVVGNKTTTFNSGSNTQLYMQPLVVTDTTGFYGLKNIQLEQGSTATPFEPYQLISDLASVKTKPKKNVVRPFADALWSKNANATVITDYNLVLRPTGANNSSTTVLSGDIPVTSGQTYTISIDFNGATGSRFWADILDANHSYLTNTGAVLTAPTNKSTFTIPQGGCYLGFRLDNGSNTSGTYMFTNPQCELGSQQTAFEPYFLVPDLPLEPQKKAIPYRGTDFQFSRSSVEPYNGMIVPMDTPRTDSNGLIVEEGTVNLSTVISAVVNGVPNSQTFTITTPLVQGGTYTLSGLIAIFSDDDTTNDRVTLQFNYSDSTSDIINSTFNSIPRDGVERKVSITATANLSKTLTSILVRWFNYSTYVSKMNRKLRNGQLEQRAYATTFTDNPLGRQAETLTFPTANVLNASAGTVEMWLNPSSKLSFIQILGLGGTRYVDATTDNNSYNIFTDSSNLSMSIGNGTSNHLVGIPYSLLAVGAPVLLSMVWKTNDKAIIYVNGVPKASVSTSTLSPSFSYGKVYVCGSVSGGSCPNAIVKSLRISNVARSDDEIAKAYNDSQFSKQLVFDDSTTKLLNF